MPPSAADQHHLGAVFDGVGPHHAALHLPTTGHRQGEGAFVRIPPWLHGAHGGRRRCASGALRRQIAKRGEDLRHRQRLLRPRCRTGTHHVQRTGGAGVQHHRNAAEGAALQREGELALNTRPRWRHRVAPEDARPRKQVSLLARQQAEHVGGVAAGAETLWPDIDERLCDRAGARAVNDERACIALLHHPSWRVRHVQRAGGRAIGDPRWGKRLRCRRARAGPQQQHEPRHTRRAPKHPFASIVGTHSLPERAGAPTALWRAWPTDNLRAPGSQTRLRRSRALSLVNFRASASLGTTQG